VLRPTPSAPDLRQFKTRATQPIEIENMRHLRVFTTAPCPLNTTIITPRWVFHWNLENGSLVKHKARPVGRVFVQAFGVDYQDAHLYAPVMRLESFFEIIASMAALSDLTLRLFDVSAAHLYGAIDGEVHMVSPSEYGDRSSVLQGDGLRPRAETHVYLTTFNYIQIIRVYTSFRSCAWPAGVLVVEEGRRGRRSPPCISDLADESQSRQMEAPKFGLYRIHSQPRAPAAAQIHFESCFAY